MYDLCTHSHFLNKTITCTMPTLKHIKDHVKQGLDPSDGSLRSLNDVKFVKQGATISQLIDVTKWFFESYYTSHANKDQKQWIENHIFKK